MAGRSYAIRRTTYRGTKGFLLVGPRTRIFSEHRDRLERIRKEKRRHEVEEAKLHPADPERRRLLETHWKVTGAILRGEE